MRFCDPNAQKVRKGALRPGKSEYPISTDHEHDKRNNKKKGNSWPQCLEPLQRSFSLGGLFVRTLRSLPFPAYHNPTIAIASPKTIAEG